MYCLPWEPGKSSTDLQLPGRVFNSRNKWKKTAPGTFIAFSILYGYLFMGSYNSSSKSTKLWHSKWNFYEKNRKNLPNFFSIKKNVLWEHFLSNLFFSKIMPSFWRTVIYCIAMFPWSNCVNFSAKNLALYIGPPSR